MKFWSCRILDPPLPPPPIIIWIAELNNMVIQKGEWGLPVGGVIMGGERSVGDEDQGRLYVEGSCLYFLEK